MSAKRTKILVENRVAEEESSKMNEIKRQYLVGLYLKEEGNKYDRLTFKEWLIEKLWLAMKKGENGF